MRNQQIIEKKYKIVRKRKSLTSTSTKTISTKTFLNLLGRLKQSGDPTQETK